MKINEKKFTVIEEAFLTYDPNFINEEILTGLQNVMPTSKEKAEFADVKIEADENWTLADKFIHFACKVECFE